MKLLRPSNGPGASPDQDGDADESRPQSSLLPAPDGQVRQQQQNFWLRRTILMAFSFLFIACALALIGVSRHITAQNGLPLSLSSSSYSWTYGPTGVLVLILALWRQVDYNCRAMQPWWEMSQGPSTAARSVLLDYISPFQPMVCVSALKNGHYAVFISTMSFFVLKLIILLSTTLFVVELTWQLEPASIRYQNIFNAEHMWDIRGDILPWSYLATLNNATKPTLVDIRPGNIVYQSLSPLKLSSNITSVTAVVDVFIPSISCQEASLSLPKTHFTERDVLYYRFNSSSCSSDILYNLRLSCVSGCRNDPRIYSVDKVDCASHDSLDNMRLSESSESDIRYAIAVADLSTEIDGQRYSRVNIKKARATICEVGYGMVSANLTQNILSGETTFNKIPMLDSSPKHLPNLTNQDLADVLMAKLNVASTTLLVDPSITKINASSYEAFSFFQLLAARSKLTGEGVDALLQPSRLSNLSTIVFEGVFVEFAQKALLVEDPDEKTSEAVAHFSENRLHLRHYTLWPIVSGFFLLSLFCIFLSFLITNSEHQLDVTGSIASFASILANSPTLLAVLKDIGHCRSNQLKRKLENMHFIINPSRNGPRIEAFGSTRKALPRGRHSEKRPWRPLPASLPVVVLCFGLPLFTISLLEILQRISDGQHGLFDFDSSSSATPSYAIRLASTLLAFVIATLFNNLDFEIAIFTPYSILRSGSVPAHRSLLSHVLGVSPFLVLVDTFRLRQFGSAASNLSTLFASFLTIIVSGLWVMGDPVQISSVSSATIQSWDTSWFTNNHDDQGASVTLNIIRHGGANTTSYIQGYDVLPKVSLGTTKYLDTTKHTYDTAVLRPILNCETVPQSEILVEPDVFTVDLGKIGISAPTQFMNVLITLNKTVPAGCSVNSSGRGDTENLVARYTMFGVETSELSTRDFWIGQQMELEATPGESKTACPSTAFLFGKLGDIEGNGPEMKNNNLTALFCSQKIEEIPATITYIGNPRNINVGDIQLHPENAKYWVNGTTKSADLAFRTKGFLKSGLTGFPIASNHTVQYTNDLDIFFLHIIFGSRGTSPWDMLGSSNAGALTEVVTRLFKEYFAHVIDLNFRSKDSGTSIQGTSLRTTTRLTIHRGSKIILQLLLAAATILSFMGYRLVKIRGTLPRNPCSIASTMGFLADSQLCDPKIGILPKDASLMTERELSQSLHGFVFSLGWWDRSKDSNNSSPASPSREDSSDLDAGDQQEVSESACFGIDVGHTNALGFSKKKQYGKRNGV